MHINQDMIMMKFWVYEYKFDEKSTIVADQ
jgi:hypothetical protein